MLSSVKVVMLDVHAIMHMPGRSLFTTATLHDCHIVFSIFDAERRGNETMHRK